jgi:tetratricopeptide (TPR) repeat protein
MTTEDIVCTNDVDLAHKQRDSYPDSPEASFIYAVALSRTSRVEDALKEVRRARKLAEKQGGPSYFDKMIDTYEKMLTYYPDDNQVRYHLAWAYYMKAYVLAKYSHSSNTPQAKYKEWVTAPAEAKVELTKAGGAGAKTDPVEITENTDSNDVLKNIQKASNTISNASPQAIPQVQRYYGLAIAKLDDLLSRDPADVWARVYRAYLHAEASGDLVTAMSEWQKVKDEQPMNPAAYFFLGEGYLKQGNLKECLNNVSKAVALRAVGN